MKRKRRAPGTFPKTTLGELRAELGRDKAHDRVRTHARQNYKGANVCLVCGRQGDTHLAHHPHDLGDLSDHVTVAEANHPDNLVRLCPFPCHAYTDDRSNPLRRADWRYVIDQLKKGVSRDDKVLRSKLARVFANRYPDRSEARRLQELMSSP